MSIEVLAIPAVAVVAVVLIVWSGRANRSSTGGHGGGERRVDSVGGAGVRAGPDLISWSSISEVAVVTRRTLRGNWFGLELQSDDAGWLLVDGSDGLVEPFLAESHRLPGFDHTALASSLASNRSRAVCYRR